MRIQILICYSYIKIIRTFDPGLLFENSKKKLTQRIHFYISRRFS